MLTLKKKKICSLYGKAWRGGKTFEIKKILHENLQWALEKTQPTSWAPWYCTCWTVCKIKFTSERDQGALSRPGLSLGGCSDVNHCHFSPQLVAVHLHLSGWVVVIFTRALSWHSCPLWIWHWYQTFPQGEASQIWLIWIALIKEQHKNMHTQQ